MPGVLAQSLRQEGGVEDGSWLVFGMAQSGLTTIVPRLGVQGSEVELCMCS